MLRPARPLAVTAVLGLLLTCLPWTAHAAPAGWAEFARVPSGAPIETTMTQRAAAFPPADVTSDSGRGSGTGVFTSGSQSTITAATPPGQRYGTSSGETYLGLRPRTSSTTSPPSETTVTFDRPTPATGWTFVFGDIDADAVTVTGTDADGEPLTAAQLGFQGAFNYRGQADLPSWDEGTATLTGNGPDTQGASGWFEPTVSVSSLTFTFTRLTGSPTYQVWFSSLAYDLTGSVSVPDGEDVAGTTVQLLDPDGEVLDQTEVDPDGGYAFPGYATYADYQVRVVPPLGLRVDGADTRTVDLSEDDRVADFDLEVAPTGTASGTVTDKEGDPVADATITVSGPEGINETLITGDDGTWEQADLPSADYTATITPPEGLRVEGPDEREFTIDEDGADVDGLDFSVVPVTADVTGTVTDADGDPVADALISVTGPDGFDERTRTDEDGEWRLDDLTIGEYDLTLTPPEGSVVDGDDTVTFTVEPDGTVSGADLRFTLVPAAAPTPTPTPTPSSSATPTPTPSPGSVSPSGSSSTRAPGGGSAGGSGTGSGGDGRAATGAADLTLPTGVALVLIAAGVVLLAARRRWAVVGRRH